MKKKIIIIVLIFVLVILLSLFFIKFYKVNKIINLMEKNSQKQNYSYTLKNYLSEDGSENIQYNKDIVISQFLSFLVAYNYYDFKNDIIYNFNNLNKVYTTRELSKNDEDKRKFPLYKYLTSDFSFKNKLKLVFEWKIENVENNCYEITTNDNNKIIFDKDTGVILRATNLDIEEKFDLGTEDYKENCVKDEDTKLPDLNEYTEQ